MELFNKYYWAAQNEPGTILGFEKMEIKKKNSTIMDIVPRHYVLNKLSVEWINDWYFYF